MRHLLPLLILLVSPLAAADLTLSVEQITRGPQHHFFGYIGHVQNIAWNADDRCLLSLRTSFQDHLPGPDEPADILLLDAEKEFSPTLLDQTRAWNPQQGTMLYWNPAAPATQFLFNDRDPQNGKIFVALHDISARRRIREYRYDDASFGNSGVSQAGGYFLGINYGRLARLRPVTGYPAAFDWTQNHPAPADDGIFRVEIDSGEKRLLVSYARLAELLQSQNIDVSGKHLFINHTLTSRDGSHVYFFVRADFDLRDKRINVPCSMRTDGSELVSHQIFMGGHPEWDLGPRIIGRREKQQAIYDILERRVVGTLGSPELFPDPEGDIALSPDARWFVNGYRVKGRNHYSILNRETGDHIRSEGFDCSGWTGGDLRLDPAPTWNRASNKILIPALAPDRTRQLFLLKINS